MILAYLDPGSGSALVGTLIAIAGAALFSLKTFFYRLVSKSDLATSAVAPTLAIFSEGKNYWGTFREIVDELIARKVHFAYYTMDLHDPALQIDSEYMQARLFDVKKASSFAKLARVQAKLMLATTPNIGTPGYPLKRPPGVGKLVHVFHAFADISAYHVGSLDNYDVVLTVGPHQEKPIREVERARGLRTKEIIPMGLPYFDAQLHSLTVPTARLTKDGATILIAPSWGEKGLLAEYGTTFIGDLARAGYRIIVRPHPQSHIAEPAFIAKCQAETEVFPNVAWDDETVGTASMQSSDLLISDTSSIRFDYAFLYGKPVITLDIPHEKQLAYEGQFMDGIWTDAAARKLGRVLTRRDMPFVVSVVRDVLRSGASDVCAFRAETITNYGTSASSIVDYLVSHV